MMITPLSKQGGRRYGQMGSSADGCTGVVSWLPSVGIFVQGFQPQWAANRLTIIDRTEPPRGPS